MKQLIKTYKGHEYVDLGLPSGTLWATCNVGARTPYEVGKYFQWGNVEGKNVNEIQENYFPKKEPIENTIIDAEHDAATVNWGGKWGMPTEAEFKELLEFTTHTRETYDNNKAQIHKFVGRNGNCIIIPNGGFADTSEKALFERYTAAYLWMADGVNETNAKTFSILNDSANTSTYNKLYGHNVRGILRRMTKIENGTEDTKK